MVLLYVPQLVVRIDKVANKIKNLFFCLGVEIKGLHWYLLAFFIHGTQFICWTCLRCHTTDNLHAGLDVGKSVVVTGQRHCLRVLYIVHCKYDLTKSSGGMFQAVDSNGIRDWSMDVQILNRVEHKKVHYVRALQFRALQLVWKPAHIFFGAATLAIKCSPSGGTAQSSSRK